VTFSDEIARRWVNHFGPMLAVDLRRRRSKPHDAIWHLDEVYLKIDGRRAVDAEGKSSTFWSKPGGTSGRRSN
jgi:transposase-like protein